VADHFAEMRNMVGIGSGAQRELEDWALSRYACYLVIQNADPSKPLVALGQTYFAIQTRRQELADAEALQENQKRLLLRAEMKTRNKKLAGVAKQSGVVLPVDYQYYNTRNRPVHDVPERDVRRRFNRSLKNLFALYRPLLDTLHCFDNSSDTPRLIFKDELGHTVIGDAALYDQLRRKFAP